LRCQEVAARPQCRLAGAWTGVAGAAAESVVPASVEALRSRATIDEIIDAIARGVGRQE
jgi:hypothetical protein